MKSLSLKAKLFGVLGLLTAVACVVAFIGLNKLSGINDRLNAIVDVSAANVKLGARIKQDVLAISRAEKNIILAATQEEMDKYANFLEQTRDAMETRRQELRNTVDDDGKRQLDAFAAIWDKWLKNNEEVRRLARLNSNVRARDLSATDGRNSYDKTETIIKQIATLNDQEVTQQAAVADEAAARVLTGARLVQDLLRMHRAEKNVILAADEDEMREYEAHREKVAKSVQEGIAELTDSITEEGRPYLDAFRKAYENFQARSGEVTNLALADKNEDAVALSADEGRKAYDKAEKALIALVDMNDRANTEAARAADDAATRALVSARILQDMLSIHRTEKNLVLEKTQEGMDACAESIAQFQQGLDTKLASLEKTASEEGKAKIAEFKTAWTDFCNINEQVRSISRENGNTLAFDLASGKGREVCHRAEAAITTIVEKNLEDMDADKAASDRNYASARMLMLTVSIAGILLSLSLGYFIIRGVLGSIRRIFQGLKTLSSGELDETAQTFNQIIDSMTEGVSQVNAAGGQISEAAQSLAEGASEQASSLEESSSALEEMAAMTRTNADNAREANDLVVHTDRAAREGDAVMKSINESSDQISRIIKVIEEIAFQTNLLALNAAVEAARAGEHGKGFAVVADEVRNLAQRAAEAARETNQLIGNSVSKSREGLTSIQSIVEGVSKVTDLMKSIAQACEEQAQGVEQVNVAVAQMDKVTQRTAAGSEECAGSAEELSAQSETTQKLVEQLIAILRGNEGKHRNTKAADSSAWKNSTRPGRKVHAPVPEQLPSKSEGHVPAGNLSMNNWESDTDTQAPGACAVASSGNDDDDSLDSF